MMRCRSSGVRRRSMRNRWRRSCWILLRPPNRGSARDDGGGKTHSRHPRRHRTGRPRAGVALGARRISRHHRFARRSKGRGHGRIDQAAMQGRHGHRLRFTLGLVQPELNGKLLVDVTVPLVPPKVSRVQLPEGGSAVVQAQALLGDSVKVVSAFQNIAHDSLSDLAREIDCDVLVCGDDKDARERVIALARDAGMRAWHCGPLANSAAAEAMTSLLIFLNIRHKVHGTGIKVTGLDNTPAKQLSLIALPDIPEVG